MDGLIWSSAQLPRDAKAIKSAAINSLTKFKYSASEVSKPNKLTLKVLHG